MKKGSKAAPAKKAGKKAAKKAVKKAGKRAVKGAAPATTGGKRPAKGTAEKKAESQLPATRTSPPAEEGQTATALISATKMVKQRAATLESMLPTTQKVAAAVVQKLAACQQVTALTFHSIGVHLNSLKADSDSELNAEIDKLSLYLGVQRSDLSVFSRVAHAFDLAYVKQELQQPLPNGTTLTWSHFVALQKLTTPAERKRYMAQVRKYSYSARDLELAMRGEGAQIRVLRVGGGRLPVIPDKPLTMLHKAVSVGQKLSNYCEAILDRVALYHDPKPEECTDQLLQGISVTRDAVHETIAVLSKFEESLVAAKQTVAGVLSQADDSEDPQVKAAYDAVDAPDFGSLGGNDDDDSALSMAAELLDGDLESELDGEPEGEDAELVPAALVDEFE
jgi:hypothetical protein